MISILNNQTVPINTDQLKRDAQRAISYLGYPNFDLGIMLADNKTMQEYNKKYRDKDTATDILSFPFHADIKAGEAIKAQTDEDKNLGDIIIAPKFVQDDLEKWNQSFEARMQTLLVHGICHLLEYDHINDDEYKIMDAKEKEIIDHLRSA